MMNGSLESVYGAVNDCKLVGHHLGAHQEVGYRKRMGSLECNVESAGFGWTGRHCRYGNAMRWESGLKDKKAREDDRMKMLKATWTTSQARIQRHAALGPITLERADDAAAVGLRRLEK